MSLLRISRRITAAFFPAQPATSVLLRLLSSQSSEGEIKILAILREKFPKAKNVRVVDISGGCGAMYEVHLESEEFQGKRTVQQHFMVNEALKHEIKEMHGLRIFTKSPSSETE
uniref:bolA-like protein 3 isoform X3 n=1 Tax=Myxine glutinosa TaxID=7769 RepID=UPI00358EA2C4